MVRWRLVDHALWAQEELGVSISRQSLGRELRALGFRKLSARPQHCAQDESSIEAFKNFRNVVTAIRIETGWPPIEIWFQEFVMWPPSIRGPWLTRGSARRTS